MAGTVLRTRALNRATLDRQLLLSRTGLPVADVVTHLVGLQAQTTHTWYLGLENRIEGLDPHRVGRMLTDGELVRVTLMRGTLHLVTPRDCRFLRPTVQPAIDRGFSGSRHGQATRGMDLDAVARAGYDLLLARPMTPNDLAGHLSERWPRVGGEHLAQAVKDRLPLVQIPPRGVWGATGAPAFAPADTWTGLAMDADPDPEGLVLRYLAAFGPASVKDMQAWSSLTRFKPVFDGLRDRLVELRAEDGTVLFDLPDAPRPDEDTEAPVRFLYDFDNVLRGHADRSRVLPHEHRARLVSRNGMPPGTVLVDGFVRASWKVVRARGAEPHLEVSLFEPITAADREAVAAEGERTLAFLEPGGHGIRFVEP
ncbi:winged helix DNA-binding domain-containing protein [Nocardiopsis changdeensis]|uniref:AlkZ family DNA glycosylase n=1 Tax=Nocardiopsis changdeensis TaxID=2831969 RepID=A0ABX8BLI5_9ACTN|nr:MULTISPECIES: winged helix DNA-binding domain-containing protein [Nocardiopsis]QUX23041.1 AlkZ family DNA glycosylase [Nocardiopsis changdeensis]QYX38986.1 winged helix DNA-binding domain-containing protein [Nocardiopsis sp. MT53]